MIFRDDNRDFQTRPSLGKREPKSVERPVDTFWCRITLSSSVRLFSRALPWRTCWKVPRARREHTRLPHTLYSQPIVPFQRFRIPEQIWSLSSSSSSSSRARISTWRENRELARASESHFSLLVTHPPLSSRLCTPPSAILPRSPVLVPPRPYHCLSRLPHTCSSLLSYFPTSRASWFYFRTRDCALTTLWRVLGGISNAARRRSYRFERDGGPSGREMTSRLIQRAAPRGPISHRT